MALKVLLMRSKLEAKRKELSALREMDPDFEKREKEIEEAIGEMTAETSEEDRTEVEGQAEKFQEEKDGHDKEKKRLEEEVAKIEKEIAEEEKKGQEPREPEEREKKRGEVRMKFFGMSGQERDAFFSDDRVKDFLSNVRTCIKEKRAINNVGLIIPEVMLPMLKERTEAASKLMKYVRFVALTGTSRQNIMGTIPEAVWTEMCASLNELSIGFNDTEMDGYKVGGYFSVCNAILEDNDVSLASELINCIGTAIGKALDKAIVFGKGTKMPLGWVTRLTQTTQPSDYPATAREWKNLSTSNIIKISSKAGIELFKEIVKASKAVANDFATGGMVWVMNKKTHTDLLVEAMGTNMAAAIVSGMGNTMPVIGGNIEELNFMADGDIAFGYPELYTLVQRRGTQVGQSEHVKFLEDRTVFKGTARYDGKPVIAEGFGILNIAGTAPTTSATFAEDAANKPAEVTE